VRVVDPRGVVTSHGYEYLDAWCHHAEAPRLFRLDRVHEAEVLDTTVEAPSAPRELGEDWLLPAGDTTAVTLLLAPPARWVPDYYPTEQVRPRRGGNLEVSMRVADPRWLVRLLLRLAPHATVVSPPDLADSFRVTAREALGWYT
jgi:proteasome accessory factor C